MIIKNHVINNFHHDTVIIKILLKNNSRFDKLKCVVIGAGNAGRPCSQNFKLL